MKKFLPLILLFIFVSIKAMTIDSMFVIGMDAKLLHISNDDQHGYLYAENNAHQKILIYQSKSPFPPDSNFSADRVEGTHLVDISFDCGKKTCTRYFNRQTNEISEIYSNVLDYNGKKDVVAYYLRAKNQIIMKQVFRVCKKPLKYPLEIERDSDFGPKTKFLSTGDLQLDYEAPNDKNVIKIIHPNYGELLDRCG